MTTTAQFALSKLTGCTGEVGRRVVIVALKQGHSVVGIDLRLEGVEFETDPNFSFIPADLRNYEEARDALRGCDAVVQLAGLRDPGDYAAATHNTNVTITWNILRSAAELGINRVAQASSVNVVTLVFSVKPQFKYFPIDEDHPTEPDEPYGLSKLICELQADAIVRRYPTMRVASIRLHWSVPNRIAATRDDPARRAKDLWGWVQEDSGAEAFLLAVFGENGKWSGHQRFFVAAPVTASHEDSLVLKQRFWPDVPIREGYDLSGKRGFVDCSKAERLLDWKHPAP